MVMVHKTGRWIGQSIRCHSMFRIISATNIAENMKTYYKANNSACARPSVLVPFLLP
jgi:hypothetical protein